MRTAVIRKARRGAAISKVYSWNAPVKGWVSNSNIADMPKNSAYRLDNWFPESNSIKVRDGHTEHADLEESGLIRTLMAHSAGGTDTIFAAIGTYVFDVTAGGVITTASADITGLTSADFIWTNFQVSGGNYLYIVNGVDSARHYNGTAWATPSITGATSSTFSYVFPFKGRLFFIKKNTATVHYLPVDAVAGAVSTLEVGGELTLGGTLIAGAAITHDAGNGPEDYCGFISSEGEVVVYSGTDPSSSTTWSKKGTFRIGRPIGARCLLKIGGDLAVLTQDGVVSLVRSILLDRAAAERGAFSSNISNEFNKQYALTGLIFGWQIATWPAGHMAIVNVPITDGVTYYKYVMNVLTGAWCRFKAIDSTCWLLAGDDLYFGTTDGRVMQYGTASADDSSIIDAVAIGAFSHLDSQGYIKHVKAAQMFTRTDGDFLLGVNIAADFNLVETAPASRNFSQQAGSLWDTALWDTATWSQSDAAQSVWLGVSKSGHFIAPVIVAQSGTGAQVDPAVAAIEFLSMNMLCEVGNPLG